MSKLSDITRQDIIDIIKNGFSLETEETVYDFELDDYIISQKVYMPFCGRLDAVDFLDRVYNLKEMPSDEHRFPNVYSEITCHSNFGDYWDEFWFLSDNRFKLSSNNDDIYLLLFVCEMLHPAVRVEKSSWKLYLNKFNEVLRNDGYELYPSKQISGRDIYEYRKINTDYQIKFPENLFSARFSHFIDVGNGMPEDRITSFIEHSSKIQLCKIMFEFKEPKRIKTNRYSDDYEISDVLTIAIKRFNGYQQLPIINLEPFMFSPVPIYEALAEYFTPYIFDLIELQNDELSISEKFNYRKSINDVLNKNNICFYLSERGLIENKNSYEVLSHEIVENVSNFSEPGLIDLLNEAINKHKQPDYESKKDAVEKIWDALERLKTYYDSLNKKASVNKIICDISNSKEEFIDLFDKEFRELTDIGNKFRIRHHEMDKYEINDIRHYDYLFNRCLSLINLAIQFLD